MKARSLILTRVQMPLRLAGLPPLAAIGLFAAATSVAAGGLVLGWGGAGFFGGVGMFVLGWAWFQARLRRDVHVFGASWLASRFWRARGGRRVFLAGAAPPRRRRARA